MNHPPRPRVLCVEDETDFRENLAEFLREESFDVLEAADGREGLEQFEKLRPDVVLCDVQMPGLSGLEMLDRLRQRFPDAMADTAFLFLSAIDGKDEKVTGYRLGCDDYLTKPVDYDLLLARLHGRLNHHPPRGCGATLTLDQLRGCLLSMLRTHLQRPLNRLLGYGELAEDMPAHLLPMYLERIRHTSTDQLSLIRLLAAAIRLLTGDYEPQPRQVKLSALVWEAYVTALGYDRARQVALPESDAVVTAEPYLHHLLLDRFLRDAHGAMLPLPHYPESGQKKEEGVAHVTATFSAKKRAGLEQLAWCGAAAFLRQPGIDPLCEFQGATLLLAAAMETALGNKIELAAQGDNRLSLRLKLTVVPDEERGWA